MGRGYALDVRGFKGSWAVCITKITKKCHADVGLLKKKKGMCSTSAHLFEKSLFMLIFDYKFSKEAESTGKSRCLSHSSLPNNTRLSFVLNKARAARSGAS